MWTDLARPVIIAHRGDKAHAPENTLAAFRMAAEKGAPAIEFDVKLTRDGRVIVIHDQTVDRTSDGRGDVRRLSFTDLRALEAGAWFSEKNRGEKIPTLDEVFEEVGRRLHMNVELTNYATPADDLVRSVADIVSKHGVQSRVIFSSFFPLNLRKAGAFLPEVPRGLLAWAGWMGSLARHVTGRSRGYFALHPHLTDVTEKLVRGYHADGKLVNVWTVNRQDDLRRMLELGVDGLFTDDPGAALNLLEKTS
jgi:glycerophosphoryl diester phosphodiesterase